MTKDTHLTDVSLSTKGAFVWEIIWKLIKRTGVHSGITATYHKIKQLFARAGMKDDINRYIQNCEVCLQAMSEHNRTPWLLRPLPIPPTAWHTISIDFIEALPKLNQYDTMLVVIDKFSKYGHFLGLSHPYTAASVAKMFMDNIYKLYGMPQFIISDRDKVFTNNLSSSYHPQTDGQKKGLINA